MESFEISVREGQSYCTENEKETAIILFINHLVCLPTNLIYSFILGNKGFPHKRSFVKEEYICLQLKIALSLALS